MATCAPPDRLNAKHRMAALLEATTTLTIAEVAARIPMSANRLSMVRAAPAYQALVAQLRSDLASKRIFDVAARLDEIAPEVWDRKLALMRQEASLPVAAQQADSFFDRIAPKPTRAATDGGSASVVRLHITVDEYQRLQGVMVEAGHATRPPAPTDEDELPPEAA